MMMRKHLITSIQWCLPGLAIALLGTGCQSMSTQDPDDSAALIAFQDNLVEQRRLSAENNNPRLDPKPEVTGLLNRIDPQRAVVGPVVHSGTGPKFDVTAKDVPVKTFLLSLVKGTLENVIPHPDLAGTVSLDLKDVSIETVLRTLSNLYGYAYEKTPDGYQVFHPKLISRIFHINYLNVIRQGSSQIRVSSGQISDKTTRTSSQKDSEKSTEETDSSSLSGSEVNTESRNRFWAELRQSLEAIVGEAEGRKVVLNSHSGVVIVRAMPEELSKVEDYLLVTQNIISRQVVLEAKILEVELSSGFQSGVNWAAFATKGARNATAGQVGGGTIFNGNGLSEIAANRGDLDPNNPAAGINGTTTSAFGGVFSLALNIHNFNAFIEVLETQGEVHVLSSPRVSTVNNQKAVIKVGSDEFFVTGVRSNTVNGSTSTTQSKSVDVELTPFFSGVALDVTPQIDENGVVTLHIHPSVSDVTEKVKQINVSTEESLSVPLALSSIRESDSIVRAASGQVVVIGGLMQDMASQKNAGIPWLSQLPVIGGLFQHNQLQKQKSELIILVRPVVMEHSADWQQQLRGGDLGALPR